MRRLLWLLLALTFHSAPSLAQSMTGAASPIGANFCGAVEGAEGDLLRCPGPAGIDAFIRSESGRSSVSLGNPEEGFVSLGTANTLGLTMEWRLTDGVPFAGVVRFRLPGEAGGDSLGDVMAVMKVAEGDRPGCLVALVDLTVNPEGRDMARRIADERGPSFQCGADEARIVGMSSDWARAIVLPELQ